MESNIEKMKAIGAMPKSNPFEILSAPNSWAQNARIKIIEAAKQVPERLRLTFARAMTGSKANAIKAKCQECCAYEDVTNRIRQCTVYRCPLWGVRPYQKDESEGDLE